MANSFYARVKSFVRLTRAQGPEVQAEFDNVETGFDNVETETNKKVEGPSGDETGWALPTPAADQVVAFNSAADALVAVAVADLSASFDTLLSGLAANDVLIYDGTQWVNKSKMTQALVDAGTDTVYRAVTAALMKRAVTQHASGKQTFPLAAAGLQPAISNGCAALATYETTAGNPDIHYLAFDKDSDEHAQIIVPMPKGTNESTTVSFRVRWTQDTTIGTTTNGVAWGMKIVAVGDNDSIDASYGTGVVVTDDAQGAIEKLYTTAESSAVTPGGAWAEGDLLCIDVYRDVSDVNDDLAGDAWLIAVELFFTTNAPTDD